MVNDWLASLKFSALPSNLQSYGQLIGRNDQRRPLKTIA